MNQFKDAFLGKGNIPHKRVTTSQKCLRVPDLERVGATPRHHTFFEMLGNFSFGDYFKKECIPWEWEFFTKECGIPEKNLVVTIYLDDEEAFRIWTQDVKLSTEKVFRFGEKENFWPAEAPSKGPNGPCGPCSEIYFDARPWEPLPEKKGLTSLPEDRFLEIGNCVFTQFDRQPDGSLKPLPQKNIDVGLGLERIAAVLVGLERGVGIKKEQSSEIPGNFETDLFQPYIQAIAQKSKKKYGGNSLDSVRMRRIADHVRAVSFCIADGAAPSNEERGYVVRKILRRACRDLYNLGIEKPFLAELSEEVGKLMGSAYTELREHGKLIYQTIRTEEERFREIYVQGMEKLDSLLETNSKKLSGEDAFKLHDTFGFPIDIVRDVCQERGVALDENEFRKAMEAQRERARAGSAIKGEIFDTGPIGQLKTKKTPTTRFVGYDKLSESAKILAIVVKDELKNNASAGVECQILLDKTPFYAEGGGQVGDRGKLSAPTGEIEITDTQNGDGYFLHVGKVTRGVLEIGFPVEASVDPEHRWRVTKNHTATHLLHKALKLVLGDQVHQRGSLVHSDYLRFDFTHGERLREAQLKEVESIVNRKIMEAIPVQPTVKGIQEAKDEGAVALFGEKYGDKVRVLTVGDYSKELCGGTHVSNTGNIGLFHITKEQALAAGIRRIVALTGPGALQYLYTQENHLDEASKSLKVPPEQLATRIEALQKEIRDLKQKKTSQSKISLDDAFGQIQSKVEKVGSVNFCTGLFEELSIEDLRKLSDRSLAALPDSFVALLSQTEGKAVFVVATTPALAKKGTQAGAIAKELGKFLNGGGGGRPDLGQGEGKEISKLGEALEFVRKLLS